MKRIVDEVRYKMLMKTKKRYMLKQSKKETGNENKERESETGWIIKDQE